MRILLLGLSIGLASSAAFAAPAPAAAPAKPSALESDVRCIIVMAALTQDKQRQQAAVIGAHFFAGRVTARAPSINLTAAIKAEEAKMQPQELQGELQRCGPIVQAAVQGLQAAFQRPAGAPAAPGATSPAAAPPPAASSPALTPPAPK